jgi:poly-gamma-glutamate capsule biosynthesis protein CapA/YwtB (metallophosphatase superfamily)
VDYVLVAIHWATSRSAEVSPENRAFAHSLIDAGADVILGHHPPHPKGIEVYHGKVIVYAPSNVLRGRRKLGTMATWPGLRSGRRRWKKSSYCRSAGDSRKGSPPSRR